MTASPGTWHWECLDPVQREAATALSSALSSKLLAIVNRGYKRDFIDLACLLRHGSHLPMLMTWAQADLPALSRETMLRALTWFDDADSQPMPACVPGWDWEQVKNEIRTAVRNAALK